MCRYLSLSLVFLGVPVHDQVSFSQSRSSRRFRKFLYYSLDYGLSTHRKRVRRYSRLSGRPTSYVVFGSIHLCPLRFGEVLSTPPQYPLVGFSGLPSTVCPGTYGPTQMTSTSLLTLGATTRHTDTGWFPRPDRPQGPNGSVSVTFGPRPVSRLFWTLETGSSVE